MDKSEFKSKNQYGSFKTEKPIGTPPQYETINSTEVIKIKKRLKDCLKNDRARVQVGRISNFGLLELSRQRLKVNEDSKISVRCWHCNGYVKVPSTHFLINQLIRVF